MTIFSKRVVRIFFTVVAPLIPLRIYHRIAPQALVGFVYHVISDEKLPHLENLYPYKTTAEFEEDLHWLRKHYNLVDYGQLADYLQNGSPLPKRAAFISFDDGFSECYSIVRPILTQYDIPCIFFLTTDWIDNQALFYRNKASLAIDAFLSLTASDQQLIAERIPKQGQQELTADRFVSWVKELGQADEPLIDAVCEMLDVDAGQFLAQKRPFLTHAQIAEMQSEGFVFGAHTRRHAKLASLSPDQQAEEIIESCRIVADLTGQASVPFAFPFSGDGVSRQLLDEIRRNHREVGIIFDTKKLRTEPEILHRIWVDKPVKGVPSSNNVAFWLHDAYQRKLKGI